VEPERHGSAPELFEPISSAVPDSHEIKGLSVGFWGGSWRRLKRNRGATAALVAILALIGLAAVGPWISGYPPYEQDLNNQFAGPSTEHWFGTDDFGRDVWTRVWAGTRISLYIAFLATLLDVTLGVSYGAVSAIFGGRVDEVMQRGVEILNGIPSVIVVVLAMLVLKPGIITISIALAINGWTYMALITRSRVLQLKGQEFVLASRSLGAGRVRLLTKHLLPNSLGPLIVQLMLTIPVAIFFEAFLSFISLGIQVPEASLGSLISDGYRELRSHSYLLWFPASILSLLMICFNLLGDGLRDALDPKMRG
jgi:oligopeptide transport system permease protein